MSTESSLKECLFESKAVLIDKQIISCTCDSGVSPLWARDIKGV